MKNKRAYKFITFKINKEEGKTTTTEVLEVHKKEVSRSQRQIPSLLLGRGAHDEGGCGPTAVARLSPRSPSLGAPRGWDAHGRDSAQRLAQPLAF